MSLGYLYLALVAGLSAQYWSELDVKGRRAARAGGLLLALVVVFMSVSSFWFAASDAVEVMRNTVYPATRVSLGGDAPSWRLLATNLWISHYVSDWGPLGIDLDAAFFWFFFPVVGCAALWGRLVHGEHAPLAVALLLYCVAILFYRDIGVAESISRTLQLSFVPANRTALGVGLADTVLLIGFLSGSVGQRAPTRRACLAIALGFAGVVAAAAFGFGALLPEAGWLPLGLLVLCNGVLAYAISTRRRPRLVVGVMVIGLAAGTIGSNPLVVGGSDFLASNPLSQRILEIDRELDGESSWLPFGGSDAGNLFRVLGVHSLGGLQPLPQLELWRQLDPEGDFEGVYNRYAHVGFAPHAQPRERFVLRREHGFYVYVNPIGEELRQLGVTHLLTRSRRGGRTDLLWAQLEADAQFGDYRIFELPLKRVAPTELPGEQTRP